MTTDVLAALDLGSNSAHLLVAEVVAAGRIRRVTTCKKTLRLTEPVTRTGHFGDAVRGRIVEAVGELLDTARKAGATEVVVVATDALRHAADGGDLVDALAGELAVRVRGLAGLEEATLSFRGIAAALRIDEPLLGLDLGGGSLELAYGEHGRLVTGTSLSLGCARVSARFAHDPPLPGELSALHADALIELRAATTELSAPRDGEVVRVAGTAGTIRDLGRLGLALATGTEVQQIRGLEVTRAQLEAAIARLVALPTSQRDRLPGLSDSRLDLLPGGGVVLLATLQALGSDRLLLCDWGLREGALLDALTDERVVSRSHFTHL